MQRSREELGDGEISGIASKKQKVDNGGSVEMAYLGPPGTYGHQAAQRFLERIGEAERANLIPCATITDVYHYPSRYLVMPLQNTIQGGVYETLDCLLFPSSPGAGPSTPSKMKSQLNGDTNGHAEMQESSSIDAPEVMDDLDLPIRHCLVAKRGTKLEAIKWVRSHEQALGQSSVYLSQHLPNAKRIPWRSTAGSAEYLLTPEAELDGPGAAICSKSVLDLYPELEILKDGTQSVEDNFTRFILLSRGRSASSKSQARSRLYALARPEHLPALLKLHRGTLKQVLYRPHPPGSSSSGEMYATALLVEVGADSRESDRSANGAEALPDGVRYLGSVNDVLQVP